MKLYNFKMSWAFALAILWIGCSTIPVNKGYYDSKQIKYVIDLDKNGQKQGKETWWYPSGLKKYQSINVKGIREGKYTAWFKDGKKWYEGFEYHGKPESTLTYWYPNGEIKSVGFFRDGIQLEREDFDEQGHRLQTRGLAEKEILTALGGEDENLAASARLRNAALQMWAMRVRNTVESYWILPKQFEKDRPYRAVAKIKVANDGQIMGVNWIEKSPSSSFNTLAQLTFKRIKRLPVFPPQIKEESLEVQYEFISLGKQSPRRKLEAKEPYPDSPPEP